MNPYLPSLAFFAVLVSSVGAAAQPVLIEDVNLGGSSSPREFVGTANGRVFALMTDGSSGEELFELDPITGATLVTDLDGAGTDSGIFSLVALGDLVCFSASPSADPGVYCTDGTGIEEIFDGTGSALTAIGTMLYFSADSGNGLEPHISNGTLLGTSELDNINPAGGSFPGPFIPVGTDVYFVADDGTGSALWITNGTAVGTSEVSDVSIGFNGGIAFNGELYFHGSDGSGDGFELWRSNGTDAGTTMVVDIDAGLPDSNPSDFAVANGLLFFIANTAAEGREIYASDGTESGTNLIALKPGPMTGAFGIEVATTSDGFYVTRGGSDATGTEVVCTDGATTNIIDTLPGTDSSFTGNIVAVGTQVVFSADDGASGIELRQGDCAAGTQELVENINAAGDAAVSAAKAIGDAVYFAADDGTSGSEPYFFDPEEPTSPGPPEIRVGGLSEIPNGGTSFIGESPRGVEVCGDIPIENIGASTLLLSNLTVTGEGPGATSQRGGPLPASISPGGSATLSVCVTSNIPEDVSAVFDIRVQFDTNDIDENPFVFFVGGSSTTDADTPTAGCNSGRAAILAVLPVLALVLRARRRRVG